MWQVTRAAHRPGPADSGSDRGVSGPATVTGFLGADGCGGKSKDVGIPWTPRAFCDGLDGSARGEERVALSVSAGTVVPSAPNEPRPLLVLATLAVFSGAAFRVRAPLAGRGQRAWAVAVAALNVLAPLVVAAVRGTHAMVGMPSSPAAGVDVVAVDIFVLGVVCVQLWLVRTTRAVAEECVLRTRVRPGVALGVFLFPLYGMVSFAAAASSPGEGVEAVLLSGWAGASACAFAVLGFFVHVDLAARVQLISEAVRCGKAVDVPAALAAAFRLRKVAERFSTLIILRAILFVSVGVAATFLSDSRAVVVVVACQIWMVPCIVYITVLGSRVTHAFQRLHLEVASPGCSDLGLTNYFSVLHGQGALAVRVWGVAVTYGNSARFLISTATVTLSLLTWGTRALGNS